MLGWFDRLLDRNEIELFWVPFLNHRVSIAAAAAATATATRCLQRKGGPISQHHSQMHVAILHTVHSTIMIILLLIRQ